MDEMTAVLVMEAQDKASEIFDKIQGAIDGMIDKLDKGHESIGKLASGMAVGGAAMLGVAVGLGVGIFKLAENAMEVGHQTYIMSKMFGMAAGEASALLYVSLNLGVSHNALELGIWRLERALGTASDTMKTATGHAKALHQATFTLDAVMNGHVNTLHHLKDAHGTIGKVTEVISPSEKAFRALGVATHDAQGHLRATFPVFLDTVEALHNIEDSNKRAQLAQELFGRGAKDLMPLFDAGKQAILEQMGAAKQYGETLTDDEATALQKAWVKHQQLNASMDALKLKIGEALVPIIEKLTDKVLPLIQRFVDWASKHQDLIAKIAIVAVVLTGLIGIILIVGAVVAAIAAGPLWVLAGVIATVVVVAIALFHDWIGKIIGKVGDWIGKHGDLLALFLGIGNPVSFFIGHLREIIGVIGEIIGKVGEAIGWFKNLLGIKDKATDWSKYQAGNDPGAVGKSIVTGGTALAAGGIVTGPTLALIGESGPEAVVPLTDTGLRGMGGMGGGTVIHNHFDLRNSTITDERGIRDLADKISKFWTQSVIPSSGTYVRR